MKPPVDVVAEMLAWMVDCPGRSLSEIKHFLPCGSCGDTGRVPRFPQLRVPCAIQGFRVDGVQAPHPVKECSRCDGSGYVASTDLADWLEACEEAGVVITFGIGEFLSSYGKDMEQIGFEVLKTPECTGTEKGKRQEYVQRALYAAVTADSPAHE